MTPRVSRRRMFVAALMASSLFAVTACASAGSRPPQSASASRQSAPHKLSASPSVTASVVPAQDKADANPPVASFDPKAHVLMEGPQSLIGR